MKTKSITMLTTTFVVSPIAFLSISCSKTTKVPEFYPNTDINTLLNAKDLKLNSKNINEYNPIEFMALVKGNLNKFILDNKTRFLSGNLSNINSIQDIESSIEQNSNSSVNIKLKLLENKWYKNGEIQTNTLENTIVINGFKKIPSALNDKGGAIKNSDNLIASSYAELMALFNLNSINTSLIELSDSYFNDILSKLDDFKNLKIELLNGSTANGTIKLKLSGTYQNETINGIIINITGFKNLKNDTAFSIKNAKLDIDQWIENLLPIIESSNKDEINNITSDDLNNKYLSKDTLIYTNSINYQLSTLIKKGVNFTTKVRLDSKNNNSIVINLEGQYQNKIYQNNQWNNEGEIINFTQSAEIIKVSLPNLKNVKSFLINKTLINEDYMKNMFPSYFSGQAYFTNKHLKKTYWTNDNMFINDWTEKISNRYLNVDKSKVFFGLDVNAIDSNDFANTINFNIFLIIQDKEERTITKTFGLSNVTKNINEYEAISTSKENIVSITPDFENNTSASKIKSSLRKSYKWEIDSIFNGNITDTYKTEKMDVQSFFPLIRNNLVNYEKNMDTTYSEWQKIESNSIQPSIFNIPFNISIDLSVTPSTMPSLNFATKLFNMDKNTSGFLVEGIAYKFENMSSLTISKIHDNAINVNIEAKTEVTFENYEKRIYPTKFSLTILKSQWLK